MDELRWILLGLGVLIVAGVYGFTHWQSWRTNGFPWQRGQRQRAEREPFADHAPSLDGEDPLFDEPDDDIIGTVKVTPTDSADGVVADAEPAPEPEPVIESEPALEPEPQADIQLPAGAGKAKAADTSAADRHHAADRPVPPFLRRREADSPAPEPKSARVKTKARRAEPSLDETPDVAPPQPEALQPALDLGEPISSDEMDVIDDRGEEKILALSVMAPTGHPWSGDKLAGYLQSQDLQLDEQGVFRCRWGQGQSAVSLYTVANIVEPGTFDANALETLSTPGVVFIMQLPGRFDAQTTFEQMLTHAKGLAEALQGQVLDGRRCDLTQQALEHMREELREYRRRAHLAGRRQDV